MSELKDQRKAAAAAAAAQAEDQTETAEDQEIRAKIIAKWVELFKAVDQAAIDRKKPANKLSPARSEFDLSEETGIKGTIYFTVDCPFATTDGKPRLIIVDAINKGKLLERSVASAEWENGEPKIAEDQEYVINTQAKLFLGPIALIHLATQVTNLSRKYANIPDEVVDITDDLNVTTVFTAPTPQLTTSIAPGKPTRPN